MPSLVGSEMCIRDRMEEESNVPGIRRKIKKAKRKTQINAKKKATRKARKAPKNVSGMDDEQNNAQTTQSINESPNVLQQNNITPSGFAPSAFLCVHSVQRN
eukprot:TRINITY_DN13111_c0_g1_i5.p2 TRINITY_DN13111_c0_g1~~TRINITY_DN13111_c0_g1_i5.p2  ORF type:complete len:102 (+),score=9.12 TRINITY_DN13111_c0_g1_i5:58-363(+)